jgi:16S rRNA (cytosine1402-N4)-methyltransferase
LKPLKSTIELGDIVREAVANRSKIKRYKKIDDATKTFQAIRIFVNNELNDIASSLRQILNVVNNGARIATISFHSLEGRIVKNWALDNSNVISKIRGGIIRPSKTEINYNPRSRSAVLRGLMYHREEC